MTPPAVLAIGLDPSFADFSAMPQFTPELIGAYIEAEVARVRELGFDVDTRLIAPREAAEVEIEAALRASSNNGPGVFVCAALGWAASYVARAPRQSIAKSARGLVEQPSVTARRFWYDTVSAGSAAALRCACTAVGAERLLSGSGNFPFLLFHEQYTRTFMYVDSATYLSHIV
jgi:hypothetical protein